MKKVKLEDFNSENGYAGGFEFTHMNTVALNEALVHWWAKNDNGFAVAGFNPGMIKTGIREPLLGNGCLFSCFECCVNSFNPSVDAYSQTILPLLVQDIKGPIFFTQDGSTIKPTPEMEDPAVVSAWINAADALIAKVKANKK